jgi:hypothetical protein
VSQVLSHVEKGSAGHSGEIKFHLVDKAPAPVFTGLERLHNGMPRRVEVLGGVLIPGRIATTDVAADHAQAEVNPSVTHLQALFAAATMRFYFVNLVRVRTWAHPAPPAVFSGSVRSRRSVGLKAKGSSQRQT